jgi:hypothetical protein
MQLSSDNMKIITILLLIVLSGAADGVRDTFMFHYSQTGFAPNDRFWNPEVSWKNKWKHGDPAQGEAFPLSSTVLVWATDAWHLCQTIMLASFRIALLVCASMFIRLKWWQWVLLFFAISAAWSAGFHFTYTLIF